MNKILYLFLIMMLFLFFGCTDDEVYTISFESNGGEFVESIKSTKNLTVILPTSSKEGYTFEGWYTSNEFTYEFDMYTLLTKDIVLYAKWVPITYTITYYLDDDRAHLDEECPDHYETGDYIELGRGYLDGYDFLGWYISIGPQQRELITYIYPTTTGNLILHGEFSPKVFTVTFDPKNGEDPIIFDYYMDDWIQKPDDPVKQGYTFGGWFTPGLNEPYVYRQILSEFILFEAKWIPIVYSISYNFQGGGQAPMTHYPTSYNADMTPSVIPIATRHGYIFLGWYLNAEGDGEKIENLPCSLFTNLILYAKWEYETYLITFNSNGGSHVEPLPYPYYSPDKPDFPNDPTKDGYIFEGWYMDEALTIRFYYMSTLFGDDITLYAKWTPIT